MGLLRRLLVVPRMSAWTAAKMAPARAYRLAGVVRLLMSFFGACLGRAEMLEFPFARPWDDFGRLVSLAVASGCL